MGLAYPSRVKVPKKKKKKRFFFLRDWKRFMGLVSLKFDVTVFTFTFLLDSPRGFFVIFTS